ncbi:MAG: hypothetical protein ACTSXD_03690 [Candidatus Heimdallarchaeaceae archaeon]
MKHYFVGHFEKQYIDILKEEKCDILCSYYGWEKKQKELAEHVCNYPYSVFLDCGAFSAWTQGKEVSLDDYLRFTVKYNDAFERIAVLDEIPKQHTLDEIKRAEEVTFKNYQKMKKYLSLTKLVPVYHFGEDIGLLKEYVKDGVDLIALGAIAGLIKPTKDGRQINVTKTTRWFNRIFKMFPRQKFHGFGIFSKKLLLTFPFYSSDSTYWLLPAIYGTLLKFNPKKIRLEGHYYKDKKTWIRLEGKVPIRNCIEVGSDGPKYSTRLRYSIKEINKYINFITKLWEKRGIVWK